MTYQPNFTDPRIQRRVRRALGWSIGTMRGCKPHGWSTRYIDSQLGMSTNPLSRYLRDVLLVTTNHHWNKDSGKCKEYILRESGVRYLRESIDGITDQSWDEYQLNHPDDVEKTNYPIYPYCHTSFDIRKTWDYGMVNQWCRREFRTELEDLKFTYDEKSNRLWHPIQNIRSEFRTPILAESGLPYNYDISTAAFTLISQYAQKWDQDEVLFHLEDYINNKTDVRNQLALELELDVKIVKQIINALLCGARIGPGNAIAGFVNNDKARMELLKQNQFITGLRSDIKKCWDRIETGLPRVTRTSDSGRERKLALSSNRKWRIYFQLERQVMSSVEQYLRESGNRYFLEHDGWACEMSVDCYELSEYVRNQTGYRIEFDEKTNYPIYPYCHTSFDEE